jgi:riboflavin kinase/FMN adenylyltransferase
MEIVRLDGTRPRDWTAAVVSVGNFDGVHRGHQALAAVVASEARAQAATAVVLTFDPHPSRVLAPERAPATLMTLEQRGEMLAPLGIERLVVLPFGRELAAELAASFARRILLESLAAREVVVGANFRFGRGRAGDVASLREFGAELGFRVTAVPPVLEAGAPISSTRVRDALARGDVSEAASLLGRSYFVDGTVIRGHGRGRTLGFPTANLDPENEILPAAGVYACLCTIDGRTGPPARAVVNLGRRPTFGAGALLLEAHLLDFEGDLYGFRMRVCFEARLRDELRFDGPQALLQQISRDAVAARRLLEKAPGNGL